jgi:DNA-binding GntR family transcriptional regulator
MILSGKLKKGQKLIQEEVVQRLNLNKAAVTVVFSRLRKEKLIITEREIGLFVT